MKGKGGLVAIVVGVLIVIGAPVLLDREEPTCEGRQMKPGDVCVDWKYGTRTYEQAKQDLAEMRRVGLPTAFAVGGLFIVGGVLWIGYVRYRVSAAVEQQRRTPRPENIGQLVREYSLDDDKAATLYENGAGFTDRYGVTRWALWDDVEDIEVSTTSGAQRNGEIVREPRHRVSLRLGADSLAIDGIVSELGEFVQEAEAVVFDRVAKRAAGALLRGEAFRVATDAKILIDREGVIRRGKRGDRRLSWSELTLEISDDRFVHCYEGEGKILPWGGFSAKAPRGAACLAIIEKLRNEAAGRHGVPGGADPQRG